MTGVKKTHWFRITLIVLIICGLIGTALAAVLFFTGENRTYVSTSIRFSFKGADEGKAPNGYRFDVSGFTTDRTLEAALEACGLTGTYTAEQLRENLNVTGIYPDTIIEQMTKYVSLLDGSADSQAAVKDYHATQYKVTLYNTFDPKISSATLSGLLNEIMNAFRTEFAKAYTPGLAKEDPISDAEGYDYIQQLELISESVEQQKRYAEELTALAPDFMTGQKGFGDIAVRYQGLQKDIDRLNATITLNAVSKDRERLKKRYEMEIRSQTMQMESLTEELDRIKEQVDAYDKDGIIYVSASDSLRMVGSDATGTYDRLVAKRKEVTDKLAETSTKIALYQGYLDDMNGVLSSAAKTDKESEEEASEDAAAVEELSVRERAKLKSNVEERIRTITLKRNAIMSDFTLMLDDYAAQEINEKTVSVNEVKYETPSLISGGFIMTVLKTAGPFCAVGFIVCMALLVRSRRKEEKRSRIQNS